MERWRLEALQRVNALVAELIATFPEPGPATLEPVAVEEIYGGRYDGSLLTTGRCRSCGKLAQHIVSPDDEGDALSRGAHCDCRGTTYMVPRPSVGTLFDSGKLYYPDPKAVSSFGIGGLN